MKNLILGFLMLLAFPYSVGYAKGITNINEAVKISGRQRMYTMRMLRDYIMIGAKVSYKDPAGDLERIKKDFIGAHQSLVDFIKDPELVKELNVIGSLWDKFHMILNEVPQKKYMPKYAKSAIMFREHLNDFTNHLAKSSGKATAEAINLSGRLRAVSQALAAVYQLRSWGMPNANKKIKIPMKRFRGSLDYLISAKETRKPMRVIIQELEKTYRFFNMINQFQVATPALVIKKTDEMLKKASALTKLYVEANR